MMKVPISFTDLVYGKYDSFQKPTLSLKLLILNVDQMIDKTMVKSCVGILDDIPEKKEK